MWKYKKIALDYDGTLVEDISPKTNGKIIKGADKFTQWLKKEGWEITISTCRPDYMRKEMTNNLKKQGVKFDYITFYGKPCVSLFVDDKAYRFTGRWDCLKEFIVEKSKSKRKY